jgi:hypothetical protein
MASEDWRNLTDRALLQRATEEWLWDRLLLGQVSERGDELFQDPVAAADFREALDGRRSDLKQLLSLIDGLSDADLIERGLSGADLRVKMGGFSRSLERVEDRDPDPSSARNQPRRWLKRLRRALTWADTYLDTLVKLIPQGDAIKELKDAAGAATDDAIDSTEGDL